MTNKWTSREDDVLHAMMREGWKHGEIGKRLGRTTAAVVSRAQLLGLRGAEGQRGVANHASQLISDHDLARRYGSMRY